MAPSPLGIPWTPPVAEDSANNDDVEGEIVIEGRVYARGCNLWGLDSAGAEVWQTHLAAQVTSLVVLKSSNADDDTGHSLVVVATADGKVSLVRGRDGLLLASHAVVDPGHPRVSRVVANHNNDNNTTDTDNNKIALLVVEASSHRALVVSQLDIDGWNDADPTRVAEAARRLHLQTHALVAAPHGMVRAYSNANGTFLVATHSASSAGKMMVYDTAAAQEDGGKSPAPKEYPILGSDARLEPWLIPVQYQEKLLWVGVAKSRSDQTMSVYWWDPATGKTVASFALPNNSNGGSVVSALHHLDAPATDVGVVAVALRSSSMTTKTTETLVVQIRVEDVLGLVVVAHPHLLFRIPEAAAIGPLAMNQSPAGLLLLRDTNQSSMISLWNPPLPILNYVSRLGAALTETTLPIGNDWSVLPDNNSDDDWDQWKSLVAFHPTAEVAQRNWQAAWNDFLEGSTTTAPPSNDLLEPIVAACQEMGYTQALELVVQTLVASVPKSTTTTALLPLWIDAAKSVQKMITGCDAAANTSSATTQTLSRFDGQLDRRISLLEYCCKQGSSAEGSVPSGLQFASLAELWMHLVQTGSLDEATALCTASNAGGLVGDSSISIGDWMVASLWAIPMESVATSSIEGFLRNTVFAHLGLVDEDHQAVPSLRAWTCQTADALEAQGYLNAVTHLLTIVRDGLAAMHRRRHDSFAVRSPFVDGLPSAGATRTNRKKGIRDASFEDDETRRLRSKGAMPPLRSVPTILQLGKLSAGATKRRHRPVRMASGKMMTSTIGQDSNVEIDDFYWENEDCVDQKLRDAHCLERARALGFDEPVRLAQFQEEGAMMMCAKALITKNSSADDDNSNDRPASSLVDVVLPFCQEFDVDFDKALLASARELCSSNNPESAQVKQASILVQQCQSISMKCRGVLSLLQSALTLGGCTDAWLLQLATDAIAWASTDSGLQSELIEASRLLRIDAIVVRHCGAGAKELFRVDNPRHSVRLLDHVTQQVHHPSALEDTLSLCEAFTHLSPVSACRTILERLLVQGTQHHQLLESILKQLFSRDALLAEQTVARVVLFAEEALNELCIFLKPSQFAQEEATSITSGVLLILHCAKSFTQQFRLESEALVHSFTKDGSIDALVKQFSRIQTLQKEFGLYVSMASMASPKTQLSYSERILKNEILPHLDDSTNFMLGIQKAQRGVQLIAGNSMSLRRDLWHTASASMILYLIHQKKDDCTVQLAGKLGLLEETANGSAFMRAQMSIALALFMLAAKSGKDADTVVANMHRVAWSTSLIRDRAVLSSDSRHLPIVVSISTLLETILSVCCQGDEGVGEAVEKLRLPPSGTKFMDSHLSPVDDISMTGVISTMPQPVFHKNWYVGDGLLLPPGDCLRLGMEFCREAIGNRFGMTATGQGLRRFVSQRGAHFLGLRVSCWSVTALSCTLRTPANAQLEQVADDVVAGISETVSFLVERSLGGSGVGITSGVIDSELAVAFMLCMPMKYAFAAYKAALPSAIKTRAFDRVKTLANVGRVASSGQNVKAKNSFATVAWSTQDKFHRQCERLSTKALWWEILENNNVEFDPQRLGLATKNVSNCVGDTECASRALDDLLKNCFKTKQSSDLLSLCCKFARVFDIPIDSVLEKHVEFILSSNIPCIEERDPRLDVRYCQKTAQASLDRLSPMKRSTTLRRCVLALENQGTLGKDYERYSMVFSLYHDSLAHTLDTDISIRPDDSVALEYELELVDRRRDALAILSSFFQGVRVDERPEFSMFFCPLREALERRNDTLVAGLDAVLADGNVHSNAMNPLLPLDKVLSASQDTATALAPLCLPLGLPQGYVHARCLVVRFGEAVNQRRSFPSLENDIVPVLNRLRSHADKCALSEWCAQKFSSHGKEKLACFDLALESAMQASTEIERRLRQTKRDDKDLLHRENDALNQVKRLTILRDSLSDCLRVTKAIASHDANSHSVKNILDRLETMLRDKAAEDPMLPPENLVSFLITASSSLIADASLSPLALRTKDVRQVANVVGKACMSTAEHYSHVQPELQCKRLSRMWLIHGEEAVTRKQEVTPRQSNRNETNDITIDEDNTADFVMDMADIDESDGWYGAKMASAPGVSRVTSEEEASAYSSCSSREKSEELSVRSSIRIAFVLAVSDNCDLLARNHQKREDKENSTPKDNRPPSAKLRKGLLAKVETSRESKNEASLLALCRELMRIAFAKSGSSTPGLLDAAHSFEQDASMVDSANSGLFITFAIRHRALRTAAFLCPQEALQQVLEQQGLDRDQDAKETGGILQSCAFAVFVAKEIEEMGLALPHSDLSQLSTMHYPSYARSLWRNHRDGDMNGSKGRTLLLLFEMNLRDSNPDVGFAGAILTEMVRLNLPRTLLLALEQVATHSGQTTSLQNEVAVQQSLEYLNQCVFDYEKSSEAQPSDVISTLARNEHLLVYFHSTAVGKKGLEVMARFSANKKHTWDDERQYQLEKITTRAAKHVDLRNLKE